MEVRQGCDIRPQARGGALPFPHPSLVRYGMEAETPTSLMLTRHFSPLPGLDSKRAELNLAEQTVTVMLRVEVLFYQYYFTTCRRRWKEGPGQHRCNLLNAWTSIVPAKINFLITSIFLPRGVFCPPTLPFSLLLPLISISFYLSGTVFISSSFQASSPPPPLVLSPDRKKRCFCDSRNLSALWLIQQQ